MPSRTYTPREVERGIRKLTRLRSQDPNNGFDQRTTREKYGWYYVDGKRMFRISSKLPSSGSVGRGRIHALRNYLHLDSEQFDDLCRCPMSGPDYHDLIIRLAREGKL